MIKLSLIGFVLGIANVIPGLSGATMAVVFNVYERLINLISPNVKKILKETPFWLPLLVGVGAGIVFASKVFTKLFEAYEAPTFWFFIGVIAGSVPVIFSRVRKGSSSFMPVSSAISCVVAFALMVVIALVKPPESGALYTELTLPVFGFFALSGALGAIAMIIPGLSGSFLLLVIGVYRSVLQAISDFNIPLLIPVALGVGIGLLLGAAFMRFLIAKAPKATYGAVLGLVAGSVVVLYPGGFGGGNQVIASILCLSGGFVISFLMGKGEK